MEIKQDSINAALDRARGAAQDEPIEFHLSQDRWVILSDQHKGARDGADDFQQCEEAYNSALGHYLELGFKLVALGDVEELWENRPRRVLKSYGLTLELESSYHQASRYLRVWGNHDDDWEFEGNVRRHLHRIFPGLIVREALVLSVLDDGQNELGTIFLVHGHQGTTFSDRYRGISRIPVRYLWRPFQRLTRMRSTTPATDWSLRQAHNIAMYRWAEQQTKTILIAGHTHRPVFRSQDHVTVLAQKLEDLRAQSAPAPEVAAMRALLEHVKAQDGHMGVEAPPVPMEKPCYFNSGCCSYSDGDVTGIEMSEGKIRLVRWPDNAGDPRPELLAEADLAEVFSEL